MNLKWILRSDVYFSKMGCAMVNRYIVNRRLDIVIRCSKFTQSNMFKTANVLFLLLLYLDIVNSQTVGSEGTRPFPKLFNAAQNRPIITEPSQGTCGVQERSAFCKSSSYPISVDVCDQDFCVQQCPGRTELPSYLNLLVQTTSFSDCVIPDTINTRPGSAFQSASTSFIATGPTCFVTPSVTPDFSSTQEFTITLWIWQRRDNNGTLVQKVSKLTGEIIFELNLRSSRLNFVYMSDRGLLTVTFPDTIPPETWTYVAIQVYGTQLTFFLNGVGPGFSPAYTVSMVSRVQEVVESWVRVGLTLSGTYQFLGRLQDFRFYPVTLSNREVVEDYSGMFPGLRVHSQCRCPASHPRVKPLQVHFCIKNGEPDNTNDHVLRLNGEAHPLEYANDDDANSIWVSDFRNQVNLVVDLGDEFQVFYVYMEFYSPLPLAVEIQRKKDNTSLQWETWQQFASDCQAYFNTVDNGPLPTPTSTNCLRIEQDPPRYTKGNITFNILDPEPIPRPGYDDFYHTPELFEFVTARQVRVKFQDHFYVKNERHRYYAIHEFSVAAWCECHGHAATCNHDNLPYQCNCLPESHTQGRKCGSCQPLYNNKPFRRGDQVDAFDCQPCECYNHASACTYNASLDEFPDEHYAGGGGVCVNCQHNTEGRFCETCIMGYYRPTGQSMYAPDVCSLCNCYPLGVQDMDMDCQKVGGQCRCKPNVQGRQCDACMPGYFNLTADDPLGCKECGCDSAGSLEGALACNPQTGQCNCKKNVIGRMCQSCQYGYYQMSSEDPDGCIPCNCNPFGSNNQYCDPLTGQCSCKDNIMGRQCDMCMDDFYGFEDGCLPCNCNSVGTEPSGTCDKLTGQCLCKLHVEGLRCENCTDETYGFGWSEEFGCVPCTCDAAGTVNGTNLCDKDTGDCVCKSNVQGSTCNECVGNTWGLSLDHETGCITCNCDPSGTVNGDQISPENLACDQNTGQCTCLPRRVGRQCDDCQTGYFVTLDGGCLECNCDPLGTLPLKTCDSQTGQCECRGGTSGVTGISCNECMDGFYKFNWRTGSCSECDCNPAGSINATTCDPIDGKCTCKEFTFKRRCDKCITGTSFLDINNPYGCSKAPDQQPPPYHEPINSTALTIFWKGPDYPNGVIEHYKVFRNGTLVATVLGDGEKTTGGKKFVPKTVRTVNDTSLQPYTIYAYVIEATNAFGSIQSAPGHFRTPPGAPYGTVMLNVTNIKSKSADFTWNAPRIMNGPLWKYIVYSQTAENSTHITQWEGQALRATLVSLIPFTTYIFYVDTCTLGGCLTSLPITFSTKSAVPEGMRPPVVMAINNTALHISWDPPEFPNGIIIFYELWMRGDYGPDGVRFPSETRIFHPWGQYNPRPTVTPQENALPPPASEYVLTGLTPFTVYQFQVLAENSAGKAASAWVSGRTGATDPLSTPAPLVMGLSPYSLNISWAAPSDAQSRGIIIFYRVYYYNKTDLTLNPFAPPYVWDMVYEGGPERMYYVMGGLSPYTEHTVMMEACNSVGCVNSTESLGRTNQDIPEGLEKPHVDGVNSSAMLIQWTPPAFPNGPDPFYTIEKTIPALSYPPQVISGTRFPGGGYYLFPSETIPPNVDFTGVRFWFRTRKQEGLLLFAASAEQQQEFVALQFKRGRPSFLFDAQDKNCELFVTTGSDPVTDRPMRFDDNEWHYVEARRSKVTGTITVDHIYIGCASFVAPTNDEGLRYNDNVWHQIIAWRDENIAYISIDNKWTGTTEARCAKGTIIGPNTGVYVGGLPADFKIYRSNKDKRLEVVEFGFQGCIRDIQIMQHKHPVEIWNTLDWGAALHNELAFLNWEGCPINLDKGVHFMGQGFARFDSSVMTVGNNKLIKFQFRTQMHTGILLFAHGGTGIYIYAAMINGALHFEFANDLLVGSVTFTHQAINFCDSKWYTITLEKAGQQATITVENSGLQWTETSGDPSIAMNVLTSSEIFLGGLPVGSEAEAFVTTNKLSMPIAAFGGCLNNVELEEKTTLQFLEESIEVMNMNMDGCTPYHEHAEQCKDDLITEVYNGTDMMVHDVGLHPYTDYLYRVLATNQAGAGKSVWGYGRTKEGLPVGVTPPYEAKHYNGYLVEFKWLAPVSTSGLLVKFILQAYNLDNTTIAPVEALFTNTSKREGNMTGTIPYTNYDVKMLACTSGGCSQSPYGLIITTDEEVPEGVPAPRGQSGSRYIYVTWGPPEAPNGLLSGYSLYMDGTLVYQGGGQSFNVTQELREYTSYVFYLKACTKVGCTQGPSATLSTSQLRPTYVAPPSLIATGTSTVEVSWETPDQLNGVLERYIVYASTIQGEVGPAVYNNSDLFLYTTLQDLIAGSTYFISVGACTGGGCTTSNASEITTAESAPGLIQMPQVTSPSPSQLTVEWTLPGLPNGEIISYDLYHNDVPVYHGLGMKYNIGGLLPYSLHTFRVVACTRAACRSSRLVKARTMEAQPEGFVVMQMEVVDARTVNVRWTPPAEPNGDMFYDVYLEGMFYTDPDNWDYSTIHDRRSLLQSQIHNEWVSIGPLIPMTTYSVQVNASNTVGVIMSNTMTANMPPGSPDGVRPPNLLSQTPTTITATWVPVGRENSMDAALYVLQFRERTPGAIIEDIFGPTTSYTYTKENLLAYHEYEFRLVAENSIGVSRSSWVSSTTRQDKPVGFDTPQVVGSGPRYVDLVWSPPRVPNGLLTEYKIYQNGQFRETTDSNVTHLRADVLHPYTYYTFVIEVCTQGGCTRSPPSLAVRTLEDYPADIPAPKAVSLTPASVEITWYPPQSPNGVVSLYAVERRRVGQVTAKIVISVDANSDLRYTDNDSELSPFEEYEYRVLVSNNAGESASAWTRVTTKSSNPAGVLSPTVLVLGPTMMNVSWVPPLQPNGVVEFYTVRLPRPSQEVRNISVRSVLFEGLTPYTEYSVTLTACTSGGCTESYPVNVRTHATVPQGQAPPEATPVSQTMISLSWADPSSPNGPNIRYELSRLLIRQPLDDSVDPSAAVWESIFSGTGKFHQDRGLPMFTTYRYRVTTFNDVGQVTSNPTPEVVTFGGFPRRSAQVTASAVSHRVIGVSWSPPSEVDLQGMVTLYKVELRSNFRNYTQEHEPTVTTTTFVNLNPNTRYQALVTITINGGASIISDPVYATTMDGAPEGIDIPSLSVVSETALRVSWMAPEKPNGDITGYNIYNNGDRTETGLTLPGSYVLTGLQPYTVYEIQLEVCTVFDCVRSESVLGTTLEALPQSMLAPRVLPLDPYTVNVMWQAPSQPNGIILRYDLWRRTIKQCSEIPQPTLSPELTKCTYVQCGILQNLCGSTCYSGAQVCCDGVLHTSQDSHQCCGSRYGHMANRSDVCCGGVFHTHKQDYKCCNGRYERVLPGEICCHDEHEDRITVGTGDSCCGTVPYLTTGSQICCNGRLYERHSQQCCGGEIISDSMVCCGGQTDGHAYKPREGMMCCGQKYILEHISLCCTSDTGHIKVHHYASEAAKIAANEKCCGLERISNGLSCCNFVGYNPSTQFCADVSHQLSGCGSGQVCPRSLKDTAMCDSCQFDPFTYMCGAVGGYHSDSPTPEPPTPSDDCILHEEKIYTGLDTSFLDDSLEPYSLYEYSVSVVNSAGTTQSEFTSITTLQARPEGLLAPNATLDPRQLYMIFLSWRLPVKPNGVILRFILTRDGIELYRGLDFMYTDDTTILPYRSYTYILTACTVAGCISSPSITVATAQAAPEGVSDPNLQVVNSTALRVVWDPPTMPNGIIAVYMVCFTGGGQDWNHNTTELSMIVADLLPFTEYNVWLKACTEVACTNSSQVNIIMPEAAPEGVYPPQVIIKSPTSVDIYWTPPLQPNGIVIFYALMRVEQLNQIHVFLGEDFHATDYSLVPGKSYQYFLTVGTKAGNRSSDTTAVTMPDNTPTNIAAPHNVTVLSATELYVEWDALPPEYGVIDQYRVLLNAGRSPTVDRGVGLDTFVIITNLMPYTQYEARIQACLQGVPNGCGTGPGVTVTTLEAPPTNMSAPTVSAIGPNIIDIDWEPPFYPNGEIIQYMVYYKPAGSSTQLLINRVSKEMLHIRHAGSELTPYTEYEYKVVAENSKGTVSSPWTLVRTRAAPPTGLPQPFVTATGAFSVKVQWVHPSRPNGVIHTYKLSYKKTVSDPTNPDHLQAVAVNGSIIETSISGLKPYTEYQLRIQAFNSAGNITSSWSTFKTGESSPSGLGLFTIERLDSGLAVILRWSAPAEPNGIITTYRIYEQGSSVAVFQGLFREFELRRLEPYREYSIHLEACTSAGCTRSSSQSFYTAETHPEGQAAPTVGQVSANSVTITWNKPVSANGKINLYEVYRKVNSRLQKRSADDGVVVHRVFDTEGDTFSYVDSNLQPYTEYQYSVKASNSKGYTFSPWQTVFTDQASPEGVRPPIVSYVPDAMDSLQITWSTPDKPNGIIQSYQLQRNESVPLSFTALNEKKHIDTGLRAYTFYGYTITACSGGGCTTSEPTVQQTKESAPLKVMPPTLFALNSTALRATWQRPQVTTGEISAYQLKMDGIVIYEGMSLQHVITGLVPFRDYTFKLTACTTGGCTDSGEVDAKPLDDVPQGMVAPILRVMSSNSIEISWKPPSFPNGLITSYDVRRDDRLVYTESVSVAETLRTTYTDYNLRPGTEYTYVILARNSKGNVESPPSVARTWASAPSGLDPPKLTAVSATSMQVSWSAPAFPNGVIMNYTVFKDSEIVYSGGPTQMNYVVPGLQFWTEYMFRVQACTDRGCTLSTGAMGRTLPSRPEEQAPPSLLALANQDGAHAGVLIEWQAPQKPNGLIHRYEVFRRQVIELPSGISYGVTRLVYNGSSESYTDRDSELLAFTKYEYSVSAVNLVGKVNSLWTQIVTKEAPPESVPPPQILETTPTTIKVEITPPMKPNGVVRYYNVLANDTVSSTGTDLKQTIGERVPLLAFQTYAVTIQACTAGGCTTSPRVLVRTGSARPSGQSAVRILAVNATAVKLAWEHPIRPNGIIRKFTLYQRHACPQTIQPFRQSCTLGEPQSVYEGMYIEKVVNGLVPYTAYEFQIQSVNDAGPIDFPVWVRMETRKAEPIYSQYPILSKNGSMAIVDWSSSFHLNSRLQEYLIIIDGAPVYSGVASVHSLQRSSPKEQIVLKIRAVTDTGEEETPLVVFDPNAAGNVGTTPTAVVSTETLKQDPEFYEEIWFIALMAVIGVLLLLILLACCIRSCGRSNPYIRERVPLQARRGHKQPFTFMTDGNEGSTTSSSEGHDRSGYYSGATSVGVANPAYMNAQQFKPHTSIDRISDSLYEEDIEDDEDYIWDKNLDSGLVSNYDSESLDGPSYSVTKDQMVFTDTHL